MNSCFVFWCFGEWFASHLSIGQQSYGGWFGGVHRACFLAGFFFCAYWRSTTFACPRRLRQSWRLLDLLVTPLASSGLAAV